ncbi:helix-turn-helix transcriptional regulator [Brevibacillus brevis]|uniref:helix-turn-helix transcriptional regulator n=1 Tax=Brevibacillus brevis TaxID=1393 RepID=UPI000D10E13D|nr:YafY family protein [Brevibacillus brevis]PSJ67969.1 transcriptional regulator [Brevibacillus brevis]RED35434.1 putative DNA-binding transcriptional regulator YafY [Brevibacillus brevis]GEC87902.1 DeoR family transcriptional regulator [Brevibacillus brevis]VEF89456.1 HTH domain [Brevibacillus brevis]
MPKSKRLLEMMMTVNRKRKFTVSELAAEFGVSGRTILRDLQELSELGVPLYSEVGPHGGYHVLKERILPPIAFSEEEAVAIFFAIHALRHHTSLPFETESSSALNKFYQFMPPDIRDRIDQMKRRVDFVTPKRQASSPHLSTLLDAAIQQKVLSITYESRGQQSTRDIQPIGIYTKNGLWYSPAYCFPQKHIRVFRCDRILSAEQSVSASKPLDLRDIHLENRQVKTVEDQDTVHLFAELTTEGVQACEAELWLASMLNVRQDGSGWLEGNVARSDILFFSKFLIGLGKEVTVQHSPEILNGIKTYLAELINIYSQ